MVWISAAVPSASLLPWSSTITWWQRLVMNSTLCSTIRKVSPARLSWRSAASISRMRWG